MMTKAEKPKANDAEEPKEVPPTKDRWIILTLTTKKFVPTKIEYVKTEDGHWVLMYHFGDEAFDIYDAYLRGEPIPVEDIREVERAERQFKNNLHRYSREAQARRN
jgi:hypothetical protein